MTSTRLSRWYPNFKPSANRSAGDDDDLATLVKGRLLPFIEDADATQVRRQTPAQSMCLSIVLSCEVGTVGNSVRSSLLAAVDEVPPPPPLATAQHSVLSKILGARACGE